LILIAVFAAVFLIAQGPALLRARRVRGKGLEGLAAALPAGVDPGGRLLLYFWSPSCGMCRNTTPLINQLQQERNDVVSLNAMEQFDLAKEAGIMGTPAFVVVDRGLIEKLVMGVRNRRQIEAMLNPG
jgi:thiol-disulfide isomerase/thioredoxin